MHTIEKPYVDDSMEQHTTRVTQYVDKSLFEEEYFNAKIPAITSRNNKKAFDSRHFYET